MEGSAEGYWRMEETAAGCWRLEGRAPGCGRMEVRAPKYWRIKERAPGCWRMEGRAAECWRRMKSTTMKLVFRSRQGGVYSTQQLVQEGRGLFFTFPGGGLNTPGEP